MSETIYVKSSGKGAKSIVLLHGFGGHHDNWYAIHDRLADHARVLAYDLPGHGYSIGYPGAGPAYVSAKAIVADLAQRGVSRAHFAGHSMGGAIAVLAALRAPETVASLTLLAPGGFGPEINHDLIRRYAAAADADALQACLNEMSGPEFVMPPNSVSGLVTMRGVAGQRDKLMQIADLITKNDKLEEIPRDSLAKLAMPTTVLWGTVDSVLPFSQTHALPANFRLEILPGCGHMLIEEATESVMRAILQATRRTSG